MSLLTDPLRLDRGGKPLEPGIGRQFDTSCFCSPVERRSLTSHSSSPPPALAKGAVLVSGGKRDGTLVEATLFDHVTPDMRIYAEESFGPVKPIVRVRGVDEALRVANDTGYGLSAAVFGRDIQRAPAVSKRIQSGICHINGPTLADDAQMPFGDEPSGGPGRSWS